MYIPAYEDGKRSLRCVKIKSLHAAAEQLGVELHRGIGSEVSRVEDDLAVGQKEQQHGSSRTTGTTRGGLKLELDRRDRRSVTSKSRLKEQNHPKRGSGPSVLFNLP